MRRRDFLKGVLGAVAATAVSWSAQSEPIKGRRVEFLVIDEDVVPGPVDAGHMTWEKATADCINRTLRECNEEAFKRCRYSLALLKSP